MRTADSRAHSISLSESPPSSGRNGTAQALTAPVSTITTPAALTGDVTVGAGADRYEMANRADRHALRIATVLHVAQLACDPLSGIVSDTHTGGRFCFPRCRMLTRGPKGHNTGIALSDRHGEPTQRPGIPAEPLNGPPACLMNQPPSCQPLAGTAN